MRFLVTCCCLYNNRSNCIIYGEKDHNSTANHDAVHTKRERHTHARTYTPAHPCMYSWMMHTSREALACFKSCRAFPFISALLESSSFPGPFNNRSTERKNVQTTRFPLIKVVALLISSERHLIKGCQPALFLHCAKRGREERHANGNRGKAQRRAPSRPLATHARAPQRRTRSGFCVPTVSPPARPPTLSLSLTHSAASPERSVAAPSCLFVVGARYAFRSCDRVQSPPFTLSLSLLLSQS